MIYRRLILFLHRIIVTKLKHQLLRLRTFHVQAINTTTDCLQHTVFSFAIANKILRNIPMNIIMAYGVEKRIAHVKYMAGNLLH